MSCEVLDDDEPFGVLFMFNVLQRLLIFNLIKTITVISCIFLPSLSANAGNPFDANKTWFLVGQDTGTLNSFKSSLLDNSNFPTPDGTSIYTNLVYLPDQEDTATLQGFYQTVNYGSGRNDFVKQLNEYKGALAVGLYMVDTACNPTEDNPSPELRNIPLRAVAGDPSVDSEMLRIYSEQLDHMIDYFKSTQRDILLRIGYEFDGLWNCYTPETYKEGFRAIKRRIDERGATNIHTVWQSASYPLRVFDQRMAGTHNVTGENHFNRWYPGDEYVDIVGMSFFFGKNYEEYALFDNEETCYGKDAVLLIEPRDLQNQILDFARNHNKPVMIAESAPQGIEIENLQTRCTFTFDNESQTHVLREPQAVTEEQIWDLWFEDYFQFIEDNKDVIKATTYINTYWNEQPLWTCEDGNCNSGYWGDSRIQTSGLISQRFAQALRAPHFKNSPLGVLGFEPDINFDGVRLEAEYAQTPLIWERGDGVNGFGTTLVSPNESNGRVFIIFNNGGAIEFQDRVSAGSNIKIRYATVTQSDDEENPYHFSVYVDGNKVGEVPFNNTGLNYVDVDVPADVNPNSVITLELNSGFVIWFDYIEVNNDVPAETPAPTPEPTPTPVPTLTVTPAPTAQPTLAPTATPASIATPAPTETPNVTGGSVFGISEEGVVYHLNGGHTANFVYLCVNGDCRTAELEGNQYIRATSGLASGTQYHVEFKVQDNSSGQCIAEASLTLGESVSSSECYSGNNSSGAGNGVSETPQPTVAPTPVPTPAPTVSPTATPQPTPSSSLPPSNSGNAVFGFDGVTTLFHVNGGHSANFVYLCINGDCRTATLEGNRYVRELSNEITIDANATYNIEFKVQDNEIGQCIVSETLTPSNAVSTSPCAP